MQVPTYGQRKVTPTALPGARKTAAPSAESLGAGLALAKARTAETLGQVGGQVAGVGVSMFGQVAAKQRELAEKEKNRADQIAGLGFAKALGEWEIETLHNEQTGALTVKGRDAQALPETVLGSFDKFVEKLGETATTDEQKLMLQRLILERRQNVDLRIRNHAYAEVTRYETAEAQGVIETSLDLIAANFTDLRRVGLEMATAEEAVRTLNKGLGPDAVEAAIGNLRSKSYEIVLEQMLAKGMDKQAGILFEEIKGQLDKDVASKLQAQVAEGHSLTTAQKTADEIIKAGGSLQEQRQAVRDRLTGNERTTAMQLVEHEFEIVKRGEREADETRLKGFNNKIEAGASLRTIMRDPAWKDLTLPQRNGLRSYANDLAAGTPVKTDIGTFYGLISRIGTDETFVEENLLNYRHLIGNEQLMSLMRAQGELRQGRAADASKIIKGPATTLQIVNETLQTHGIDPDPKKGSAAVSQFRGVIDQRIEALGGYNNLKNEDIRAVVDSVLLEQHTVGGSTWSGMLFRSEGWSRGQTLRTIDIDTIGEVPRADREQIREAFKKRGITADDATILATYRDRLWNKKD